MAYAQGVAPGPCHEVLTVRVFLRTLERRSVLQRSATVIPSSATKKIQEVPIMIIVMMIISTVIIITIVIIIIITVIIIIITVIIITIILICLGDLW